MRRSTVACSARTRSADCSRAISRSMGSEASLGKAVATAASRSASTRAITGTTGPSMAAISWQMVSASAAFGGGPGSAMTMAAGSMVSKAAGISAQLASTMGKAPAALSAATRSAAGLSATTIIGACRDMAGGGAMQ